MSWLRKSVAPSMVVTATALVMAACSANSDDSGAGLGGGDDSGTAGDSAGRPGDGGGSGHEGGSSGGGFGDGAGAADGGKGGPDGTTGSDSGSPTDGGAQDAPGVVCTNTDNTIVTLDATGAIYPQCNIWNIQGAWYCYQDGVGTTNCVAGVAPYVASAGTAGGMCISGTTSTGANAYGAGIGMGLNSTLGASPVKSTIADASIIGFEITLTGGTHGSGGSVLNVNMTTGTKLTPAVTIPGVAANSTITYDVYIKDALESFVPSSPVAKPGGIYDLQVAIPAGNGIQYDYCVTKVKPITAPVALNGACGSTVAYGPPFCNQPQEYLEEVGNFGVQNDTFANATGQMCIQAMRGGASCTGFTATFNGFGSSAQYTPGAFPSLVYGWQSGNFYGGYTGGTTAGNVKTATSDWTFSVNNVGQYDAAYDIWFAPSQNPANANGGLELMVWLQWSGVNPADYPAGPVGTVTSGGRSFAAHRTTVSNAGSSWTYLAYLANSQTSSVSGFDLMPFIADAMGRGLGSGWYLLGIQSGFEVYNASGSATTSNFDVKLQ
jgi:hypothetical protein